MIEYEVLRVFTRDGAGGNLLGVVLDRPDLGEESMQSIAAQIGFSETIFIDRVPPVPEVRIFTPGSELGFAGHPLVGAGWLLGGFGTVRCPAGLVAVSDEGGDTWIQAPFDWSVGPCTLDLGGFGSVVSAFTVEMSHPYHVAEFEGPEQVAEFDRHIPQEETYVWAWVRPDSAVHARFFAPNLAVPEDPATGSAAVAFARTQVHRGVTDGRVEILQGEEMGAPSRIWLDWDASSVRIGGAVVSDGSRRLGP